MRALAAGESRIMATSYLVVRAVVADPADRKRFDHWYETEHLPDAVAAFRARRGWRCWSRTDPAVHVAFYEFASVDEVEALAGSPALGALIAEFDRVWGTRVRRSREILEGTGDVQGGAGPSGSGRG